MGRWAWLHIRFRSVLKSEFPDIFQRNNGFGIQYTSGLEWVDFALRRAYTDLGSERLNHAGEALSKAYDKWPEYTVYAVITLVLWSVSLTFFS